MSAFGQLIKCHVAPHYTEYSVPQDMASTIWESRPGEHFEAKAMVCFSCDAGKAIW